VRAFYQQELTARGWQMLVQELHGAPAGPGKPHGFQPTPMPAIEQLPPVFCQSPAGPWLSLGMFPLATGLTDVRLFVGRDAPGPCAAPPHAGLLTEQPPEESPIPPLSTPTGVQLQGMGEGKGQTGWFAETIADTTLEGTALEAHFAQQLQAAGWTWVAAGRVEGRLAWSLWTVPGGDDWEGLLLIRKMPGANRQMLRIEVTAPQPSLPSRAWGWSGNPGTRLGP
jgi:hypothetical protein